MTPDTLADLHRRAFAPQHGWTPASFAALLESPHVHLLHRTGGFLLARIVAPEAEVLTLAVAPEARRARLASALLDTLAARAEVQEIFLEVAQDNGPALALYGASGFVRTGLRKGYYQRPGGAVDAVLMRRATGQAPAA